MKYATFTVRGTVAQSARWKRAAEAEGFASAGAWLAAAADAYLEHRSRAGRPLPLVWRRGRFRARLEDGAEPELPGFISRPFGIFRGGEAGPGYMGCKAYSLVYLPERSIVATFCYARQCRALAAELAREWVRWEAAGTGPPGREPGPIIERHRREAT